MKEKKKGNDSLRVTTISDEDRRGSEREPPLLQTSNNGEDRKHSHVGPDLNKSAPGPDLNKSAPGVDGDLSPTNKSASGVEIDLRFDEELGKEPSKVGLDAKKSALDVDGELAPSPEEESSTSSGAGHINMEARDMASPPSLTEPRRVSQPGAFAVGGGGDDGVTTFTSFSESQGDDPVTAELVDLDVERRRVSQQVELGIRRELENTPVAEVVEEKWYHRRRTVIILLVLAIFAILAIVLAVTLPQRGPPPSPVPSRESIIEILAPVSPDGGEALQMPGSAQNEALNWLSNDTFQGYYTNNKLIQRYALATFYYGTNGDYWFNNSMWLDDGDECGRWEQTLGGLTCDPLTGDVTSLGLGKNNLTGALVPEIGLLTGLVSLGLSQNEWMTTIPTEIGKLVRLS